MHAYMYPGRWGKSTSTPHGITGDSWEIGEDWKKLTLNSSLPPLGPEWPEGKDHSY